MLVAKAPLLYCNNIRQERACDWGSEFREFLTPPSCPSPGSEARLIQVDAKLWIASRQRGSGPVAAISASRLRTTLVRPLLSLHILSQPDVCRSRMRRELSCGSRECQLSLSAVSKRCKIGSKSKGRRAGFCAQSTVPEREGSRVHEETELLCCIVFASGSGHAVGGMRGRRLNNYAPSDGSHGHIDYSHACNRDHWHPSAVCGRGYGHRKLQQRSDMVNCRACRQQYEPRNDQLNRYLGHSLPGSGHGDRLRHQR